ncbi:hypothetical protein EVAR_82335_1 [Eumeta japonica]|uniref:Uncharacterized protein n=1 Tax=Eumeta variegata TaxID=151549 RepID=A0A4C1U9W2_EUMVA|nr:hypothetical protein EVAR_82335_1 [Eumeta japonica]
MSTASPSLVEYVTEGFKTKQKNRSFFFDVAKAFDRVWHAGTSHSDISALTRPDVLSEQEFLKAPLSLPCCTPRTRMTYRDRRPTTNSRYSTRIPRSIIGIDIGNRPSSASRRPLMS